MGNDESRIGIGTKESTNYSDDPGLLDRAAKIYEVESQSARHYETLRTQTTNVVVIGTGALVAFGIAHNGIVAAILLLAVAVVAFAICTRLKAYPVVPGFAGMRLVPAA